MPEAEVNLGYLNDRYRESCRSDSAWLLPLSALSGHLSSYRRVFNTCNDLDGTTACFTGRYIDIEYSFQVLCPAYGGMLLHRRSLIGVYLAFGALASFRRRRQGSVFAIGLMRHSDEHAMEACQIDSRPGHQGGKPSHEIQRANADKLLRTLESVLGEDFAQANN